MKKVALTSLAVILLFGCKNQKDGSFLRTVRDLHKPNFKELKPVPYKKLIGRVPSLKEIELGRSLFSDTILSRNNDVSCATCHLSNHGFADGNSLPVGALGAGGPTGDNVGSHFGKGVLSTSRAFGDDGAGFLSKNFMFRNSLSTVNVGYRATRENETGLFHDGRFGSLLFQTLLPIHTSIEMCGDNPIPEKNNPFKKGGIFFSSPVVLNHVNTFDPFEGRDTGLFNGAQTKVEGVPSYRPNGVISIPGRNECLAIAIAKLRYSKNYTKRFKEVYDREVTDQLLAAALSSYVLTHVSKDTPYDRFMMGKDSLSHSEAKGLVSFFTPLGEVRSVGKMKIRGAGCFNCHKGATFGGSGFSSLGVRSDSRSPLTKPSNVTKTDTPFFGRGRLQRGVAPNCHLEGVTSQDGYAPDIGRAGGSFDSDDCFKFRIPPLRNVVETYPYFHHGSARAQGKYLSDSLEEKAKLALTQVVNYHLNGPVDPRFYSKNDVRKVYFDKLHQKDFYVPFYRQNFLSMDGEAKDRSKAMALFPAKLSNDEVTNIVNFISNGLWDRSSSSVGDLGNKVGHPEDVPSGFSPSVTRDNGNQLEIPE